MAVKILYFSWEASYYDTEDMLKNTGVEYKKITGSVGDVLRDSTVIHSLKSELIHEDYDFIFSYDYFPEISELAQMCNVRYISWIYDCPHYTLYSENVSNKCNYFFIFDKSMEEVLKAGGAIHIYQMPLAINTIRLNKMLGQDIDSTEYKYDVSFVGSLYDNNLYDQIAYLPEKLKGYLDGIINAQTLLGENEILEEIISDRDVEQLKEYIKLPDDNQLKIPHKKIFTDMLSTKVTSVERITNLNKLSEIADVHVFSASDESLCPKCKWHGYIDYASEMPVIFRKSKININTTLRTIKTGIPLRCLDIMGAGGFLLSNYQEDLCKYFKVGRDFAVYENLQDLLEKTQYYLENEDERMKIAINGWKNIQRFFRSDLRMDEIIQYL